MHYNNMFLNVNKFSISMVFLIAVALANPLMAQEIKAEASTDAAAAIPAATETGDRSPAEEAAELDPGMQIPVDGSSLEAFEKSLAGIKEQAQEINYVTLEEAINYLLVYDLGAGRDKAKLAKNLDGLTGEEIVGRVHWRKPPPARLLNE